MTSRNSYHRSRVEITHVHSHLEQEVVEITVDRLKLILKNHMGAVEKQNSWKGDLAVAMTLLLAVLTSDFKSTWGVEGSVWRSLFIIGCFVYAGRLIVSLVKFFKAKNRLDELLQKIKSGTDL